MDTNRQVKSGTAERPLFGATVFSGVLLLAALLSVGTIYECVSCVLSVLSALYLLYILFRRKEINVYFSFTFGVTLLLVLAYAAATLWAVDRGEAFLGFLKFLPLVLFLAVLMQECDSRLLIEKLPYAAAVMTVLSVIGKQIPALNDFFSVQGRLGGFFQYPNTFAMFLLVSQIVAVSKRKNALLSAAVTAILLFGILYTGSRSVFVLAVFANAVLLLKSKNRCLKAVAVSLAALAVLSITIYFFATGKTNAFTRFLTISFKESTFIGRLLYFKDALSLVIKYPFGLGYMGYSYVQQSVQTGVYYVRFVHNDFLQTALDVGLIPAAALAAMFCRNIFSKKTEFYKKLVLTVSALHCCFDFDLQFVSFFMLLLLFMGYEDGKKYTVSAKACTAVFLSAVSVVCIWFSAALFFELFGNYEVSQKLYKYNTENEIAILKKETDLQKAEKIADDILERNGYAVLALDVKAKSAYSDGDFEKLIEYKTKIFEIAPFNFSEYEEYCYMLMNGISLYTAAGDNASAEICRKEFVKTVEAVKGFEKKLSSFGKMIDDKPQTELPKDIENYFKTIDLLN